MRIGIDARLWNETGVGRYIRALVGELGKIDAVNEYKLFLLPREVSELQLPKNFEKVAAPIRWHSVAEQLKMPKVYKKAKLDLLHIPYFSVPLTTPQPFIVTIHDLTISHFATGKATTQPLPLYALKRLGYLRVLRSAIERSAKIITVSQSVKNQILHEFNIPENKISVTYESGEMEIKTKKELRVKLPAKYLLYVGNAHPHKNLERLIDAFTILHRSLPKLQLVLIGKHDYFYNRLQQFVYQKKLTDSVVFPGEVTNSELHEWYSQAGVFVFPSLSEGFGIPGLEAMGSGCVVAASDIPVFHEVYGNAVHFFNERHTDSISQALIELLNDQKLRRTLKKAGFEQVQKYSWSTMARKTIEIYESSARIRSH